jgi:hypothetical protein
MAHAARAHDRRCAVVRIPVLSERTDKATATSDENADGRVDERDDRMTAKRVAGETTTVTEDDRGVVGRAKVDERLATQRRLAARTAAAGTVVNTSATPGSAPDATETMRLAGPRPRASLMATLSLILGVSAALTVLTGLMAGPGVALGLLAAIFGFAGISATSRRHVAGKSDALLGLALALGAIVVGCLALTGTLPWLSADTDIVNRSRDWLDSQLPWLFPSG